MSAIGEVSPGSFDSYEGIRILIPGAIVSAVGYLVAKTVAPSAEIDVSGDAITWIVVSLTMGLLLYFLDFPAKSAAFHELQPTNFLESKFPDVARGEVLTTYLLILNTIIPANTRNRALYIGSMYRIGFEMVVFGGVGAACVFACSQINYGPSAEYDAWVVFASAGIVGLAFVVGLALTSAARARSRTRAKSVSGTASAPAAIDAKGYGWPWTLWSLGATLMCLSALISSSWGSSMFVLGFALSIASWIWLYAGGVKADGRQKRARLEATAAMYAIPIVFSLVLPRWSHSILGAGSTSIGWSVAAGLVIILMMSGGHEGKLHGVYRGQTRWLTENLPKYDHLFDPRKE